LPPGCAAAGQNVTCTAGTLNAGSAQTFDIPVTAPVVGAATAVANTATLNQASPPVANDVVPGNNSATINFTIVPPFADLSITKAKTPNPIRAGDTITNTIRVTNAVTSPNNATGTIRVTEEIQSANEEYLSGGGGGWTCAPAAGPVTGPTTVTCDFAGANLAPGATLPDLIVTTRAAAALPPGFQAISNRACTGTTAGSPHTPADNNAANDCTTVSTVATTRTVDIGLTKAASVAVVTSAMNSFTYTIVVSNSALAPDTAPTVVVNDPIPMYYNDATNAGTTGVSVVVSGGLGAGESCTTGATVSCTLKNLAPGASRTLTITVTRPFNSGAVFTNTATWTSPDAVETTNVLPNTAQATVQVDPVADVAMEGKTSTPEPVRAGVEVTYTLSVKNRGPSAAQAVVVKDPFDPTRFDFVAGSASVTGGGSCAVVADLGINPVTADPNYAGRSGLRCDFITGGNPTGQLLNGETRQIIFKAIPKHPYPDFVDPVAGTPFTNRAKVATTTTESSAANNDVTRVVTVTQPALDLRVTKQEKTPPGDPVAFGDNIVYLVTVRNVGPSQATRVRLLDTPTPPAGYQMTFASFAIDPSSTYTPPAPTCTAPVGPNQPVTCRLHGADEAQNVLPANRTVVFELQFSVGPAGSPPSSSLTFSNTALVSSQETLDGFDLSPANNSAVESTTVLPKTDLEVIDKAASASPLNVNQPFTYTVRIRNKGPSTSTVAVLTDALPAGFEKMPTGAILVTPGSAQTLTTNTCSGTTTITCNLGPLLADPGGVADPTRLVTIQIPVRAKQPFAGPFGANIANTASIAPLPGTAIDPVAGNNSAATNVQVQKSSLAGTVYTDSNRNAAPNAPTIDPGEGIAGVTLTLTGTDAYGNRFCTPAPSASCEFPPVAVQTGGTGTFLFDNLPPGNFTVVETQPAGYFDRKEYAGTSGGTADNATFSDNAAQNTIAGIVLAPATAATGYVFEEYQAATVRGFVYEDLNNDGLKGGGEPAAGVGTQIVLTGTDYAGNPVNRSATVQADGSYVFANVPPDNGVAYTVTQLTQPAGFLDGKEQRGAGVTLGNGTAGRTAPEAITGVSVAPGANVTDNNFGELRSSTITGVSFTDLNGNTTFDNGEGIPGVTVTLTGTDDLGNAVNCTTSTDGTGRYTFPAAGAPAPCNAIRPGTYTITETKPVGLNSIGATAGTVNGSASGATGATGPAAGPGTQFVQNVVIGASGASAINYNFGHGGAALGGSVYVDANNNGVRDPGEQGIPGVAVTLSGNTAGAQAICTAYPACSVTTDSNGFYLFTALPASDGAGYTIQERTAGGAPSPILSSYVDGIDSRGTVNGVATGVVGNDAISGVVVGVGQIATNYNFGERGSALSGSVYVDANDNGVREGTEQGIAGVQITLSGTTASGANVCTVIPSCVTTTDASGNWSFPNLPLSNGAGYTVVESHPAGYADGRETAGTLGGTVNNGAFSAGAVHNTISGIPVTGTTPGTGYLFGERVGMLTGRVCLDTANDGCGPGDAGIAGVTLMLTGIDAQGFPVNLTATTDASGNYVFSGLKAAGAGGYTVTETQPAQFLDGKQSKGLFNGVACGPCDIATPNQIRAIPFDPAQASTAFDFGEVQPASLSGSVYHDVNGNLVRNPGEGLPGVTVTLTGLDDRGNPVSIVTTTDASGNYTFPNLRPGTYVVTETQPAGIADGGVSAGSAGGVAGVNTVTGIVLGPGVAATGYDFRENASSLAGSVYVDANNNGVRDPGEQGIAGVTVTLSGSQSRTAVTDAQGNYLFAGLPAGTYTVTETQPPVYQDGTDRVGTSGGTLGNDVVSNINLAAGTNATNYEFGEKVLQPGQIAGTVWFNSVSRDNVQQPGEPGQANWTVELVKNGVVVRSAVTDANGNYSITGIPPDTGYELRFRHPANTAVYGSPASPNPVPGATYGRSITNVTVGSGANFINQNLPIDPSGVIYNPITGTPIPGASVTLVPTNCTGPFDPAAHLLGGAANQTQVTGADGFYQFLLLPGAPTCDYQLRVTPPPGFLPVPSVINPPRPGTLTVGAVPNPLQVSPSNTAPAAGTIVPYFLSFRIGAGSADVIHNHIPLDPVLGGAILIQKSTPLLNVSRGDLVPYTITAINTTAATLANVDIRDTIPPGFRYVPGSGSVNGLRLEPTVNGRAVTWANQTFTPGERKSLRMVLAVGAGVGEGEYVNTVLAANNVTGTSIYNTATATVRVVPDPTFDCSDLIGRVFDDRNANGYQDEGERGLPGVRVVTPRGLLVTTDAEGRFHVTCAEVPQQDIGSNFVMKLDERTLPSGYRLTTENPHAVRATRGKMVRLNFGATIHRVIRIELTDAAFVAGDARLRPEWQSQVDALPAQLRDRPSVVRVSYVRGGEAVELADRRVRDLTKQIRERWAQERQGYPLTIEDEIESRVAR
jgi:uncharacterized repeat protein (TIGR01451 family)